MAALSTSDGVVEKSDVPFSVRVAPITLLAVGENPDVMLKVVVAALTAWTEAE